MDALYPDHKRQKRNSHEKLNTNQELKTRIMKTKNTLEMLVKRVENATKLGRWECPVCGMDEWCGTDGCPMDPQ